MLATRSPSHEFYDVPTQVGGINDSGQIVGWYPDGAGREHGFLFDHGSYTTLDVPGSSATYAQGINASGQIVGYYVDATGTHGFVATPTP
jgi:probable HAF family extracellular repeat protein